MIFSETDLKGLYLIEPDYIEDERGFFARTFCVDEFQRNGLEGEFSQCNISYNAKAGAIRGMHYQKAPHQEIKLIRCTMGSIFDVVVDIRGDSDTYLQWYSIELSAQNRKQLYVPTGFAHGFQVLIDDTEVFYQMSRPFYSDAAAGNRWDDPSVGIAWPMKPTIISSKDRALPPFGT